MADRPAAVAGAAIRSSVPAPEGRGRAISVFRPREFGACLFDVYKVPEAGFLGGGVLGKGVEGVPFGQAHIVGAAKLADAACFEFAHAAEVFALFGRFVVEDHDEVVSGSGFDGRGGGAVFDRACGFPQGGVDLAVLEPAEFTSDRPGGLVVAVQAGGLGEGETGGDVAPDAQGALVGALALGLAAQIRLHEDVGEAEAVCVRHGAVEGGLPARDDVPGDGLADDHASAGLLAHPAAEEEWVDLQFAEELLEAGAPAGEALIALHGGAVAALDGLGGEIALDFEFGPAPEQIIVHHVADEFAPKYLVRNVEHLRAVEPVVEHPELHVPEGENLLVDHGEDAVAGDLRVWRFGGRLAGEEEQKANESERGPTGLVDPGCRKGLSFCQRRENAPKARERPAAVAGHFDPASGRVLKLSGWILLIPPSESKVAPPARGPTLVEVRKKKKTNAFPELEPFREMVQEAVRVALERGLGLEQLFEVSGSSLDHAIACNRRLLSSTAVPARQLYSGVMWEAIGYEELKAVEKRRFDRQALVFSALFGLLRPTDCIPLYKLKMGGNLGGNVGKLVQFWRRPVSEVLRRELKGKVVWDFLPDIHRRVWDNTGEVVARHQVKFVKRIVRGGVAEYKTISHHSKALKGALIRHLLKKNAASPKDLKDFHHPDGYTYHRELSVESARESQLVFAAE